MGNISSGLSWPPHPVTPLCPWGVPLFNTVLLLFSGSSCRWGYEAVKVGRRREALVGLSLRCLSGLVFLGVQMHEYKRSRFCISDGAFGSSFYFLTGLHGVHVLVGVIFLRVQTLRTYLSHFADKRRWCGLRFSV